MLWLSNSERDELSRQLELSQGTLEAARCLEKALREGFELSQWYSRYYGSQQFIHREKAKEGLESRSASRK